MLYRHPNVNPPLTVSAGAVETLVDMMQEVVRNGTGRRATLGERPVAGKTGTSSDYRDAWFIGFTGDYTTGIWLGNDDGSPMRKIVGGSLPAQLWHDYMADAEAGLPEVAINTWRRAVLAEGDFGAGGVTHAVSRAFGDFIDSVTGATREPAELSAAGSRLSSRHSGSREL